MVEPTHLEIADHSKPQATFPPINFLSAQISTSPKSHSRPVLPPETNGLIWHTMPLPIHHLGGLQSDDEMTKQTPFSNRRPPPSLLQKKGPPPQGMGY